MEFNYSTIELVATICFGLAVLHTFLVKKFEHLAHKYPEGSVGENFFHFLGEVEAVFGLWALVFIIAHCIIVPGGLMTLDENHKAIGGVIHFLETNINYTEPAFVFVIMTMAATRPVIKLAEKIILFVAGLLPMQKKMAFYVSALIIGPILGSFITEPAAMTVTALILLENYYQEGMSDKFKYATIGLLFVNISIGGTLTHFAAPPVLMVAGKWHWGISHMATYFGWKAVMSIIICTLFTAMKFKSELQGGLKVKEGEAEMVAPWWITMFHLVFLGITVYTAHHMVFFLGVFLFFLGFAVVTQEYQDSLKLKESLLVGFFLGGLVTLGYYQGWWLKPILGSMGELPLFLGATGLTAFTDNAALTYLGTLVDLTDGQKYFLVAGAVAGGGLTVIANAPNPAGFGLLKGAFGEDGISPLGLAKAAALPTLVAMLCLKFLPPFA